MVNFTGELLNSIDEMVNNNDEIVHLTLSQTKTFRLLQTERVCRRQFQIR